MEKLIRGRYIIPSYDQSPIEDGCVIIKKDIIIDVGRYKNLKKKYQGIEEIGDGSQLVIPGLVNAHSHGRGISDFQRGNIDNTLETWLWSTRTYIPISTYNDVLFSAIRLIESGVTTTMHNHILKDLVNYEKEFSDAINAYIDIGLRVNFCPAIRNKNLFVYGDNNEFLNALPEEMKKILLPSSISNIFSEDQYLKSVLDLNVQFGSEMVKISYGPLAPQWCSDELLKKIKNEAEKNGFKIHIHALQTSLQKIYALKSYGKSLIEHMEEIGFLGENLSIGHCVFPTIKDIDILAKSKTSVSHHPSCNLRERNGISPVHWMVQKGVRVGIGLDGKGINDDDDFIQEMRMCYLLHRLWSHELDSPYLTSKEVFKMATVNGAEMLGFGNQIGKLEKGRKADIVLIDLHRISDPYIHPQQNIFDILLYRAKGTDVNTVLINGEIVMKERKILKINKKELSKKIREEASRDETLQEKIFQNTIDELRKQLCNYYRDWYKELVFEPFYIFNSKK